ncbi:unnamed protein product, partial [Durusdinium trenchii]
MFADMAPIRIDSSHEEEVVADQVTVPTVSTLAQETVDILGPLEGELEARMSRDGQLATSIIHMGKALEVIRGMLAPARTELLRTSGLTTALRFDASDVARMYERVIQLFATLRGADAVGDVGDAFRDAYRRTRASRADVLCIWNAAVEQGKRIGVGQARGAVDRGKLPARECYATHWLPSAVDPDNPQPVSIVNLERALQFLVSACPAWDKHLYSALDGEGNLQLLLYNDE